MSELLCAQICVVVFVIKIPRALPIGILIKAGYKYTLSLVPDGGQVINDNGHREGV